MPSSHRLAQLRARLCVCAACAGVLAAVVAPAQISITDLGTFGGTGSTATGINDAGQVIGNAFTLGNAHDDPFLWTSGASSGVMSNPQMQNLYPGSDASAVAVNNSGDVVGDTTPGSEFQRAYLWTPAAGVQMLGTLGGFASVASGINDSNLIVGGSNPNPGEFGTADAFLWTANGTAGPASNPQMQNVGPFITAGITNLGSIAGTDSQGHAATYYNGIVNDLGTLGGTSSGAVASNTAGLVAGTSLTSSGQTQAFLWTPSGLSGNAGNPQMQDLGDLGSGFSVARGIDNDGDVVGSSNLANGAMHAFLYTPSAGMQDLNSILPNNSGWTLISANGINNHGQIVGQGTNAAGQRDAFLLYDPALVGNGPAQLVWCNTPSTHGDGATWDIGGKTNWNNGAAAYTDGSAVTFDDSTTNTRSISLNVAVRPSSITVNTTANHYTITGTGSIAGTGSLTLARTNTSTFSLQNSNTYTGGTNVSGGTLSLDAPGAFPAGTGLTIGAGAVLVDTVTAAKSNLFLSMLTLAGTAHQWTGKLDLGKSDLVLENGNLATLDDQIKQGFNAGNWKGGGGIVSSAAAVDPTHTTALGSIQNSVDGTTTGTSIYTSFDGQSVTSADVLVKYTYYGDANLDGKVDGGDYSRIDSGYLSHATGWFNGDFNYDGVVNGSDYTLIDNACNNQGTQIADQTARITAEVSVPEPSWVGSIGGFAVMMLRRRRRSYAAVKIHTATASRAGTADTAGLSAVFP